MHEQAECSSGGSEDAPTMLLLIRHAKARDRLAWQGDDWLRPLKKKGLRQAAMIAERWGDQRVCTLRTSPALRCVQTLEPLASRTGLQLIVDERIAEGMPINPPSSPGIHAICAHGDNIPHLLGRLNIEWQRCQKGSIWVVTLDCAGSATSASYQPPPAV